MAVKSTGQMSFVDALFPQGLAGSARLDRLQELVKWYRFEKLLKGLRSDGPGAPGYPPIVMFKAVLLQSLYGLSEAELEEAIVDRLSFRRFVGLGLEDRVPDHTTLCRFRNLLVHEGLLEKLFAEFQRQMDLAGVIVKRGTMLDATVIEAVSRRPPEGEVGKDPDAGFLGRRGKGGSSYGYKAHVGVDRGSGIIRKVITTPANVTDTTPADLLICGDEREVYADKAYDSRARREALKAQGKKPRIARRANKHHPVLSTRLQHYNQLLARRRAGVETTFATLKRRMGLTMIRYVGLKKATAQVLLAAMAFNLRRWAAIAT
jgi:IS5 family transposase